MQKEHEMQHDNFNQFALKTSQDHILNKKNFNMLGNQKSFKNIDMIFN